MFQLKQIRTDEIIVDFGIKDQNLYIHIYKGTAKLENLDKILDPLLQSKFNKEIEDIDILREEKYKELEEEIKKRAFTVTIFDKTEQKEKTFNYHHPISLKSIRDLYSNTKINKSFTKFKDENYNSWNYIVPNFTNAYNVDDLMLDLVAKIIEKISQ